MVLWCASFGCGTAVCVRVALMLVFVICCVVLYVYCVVCMVYLCCMLVLFVVNLWTYAKKRGRNFGSKIVGVGAFCVFTRLAPSVFGGFP